MIFRTAVTLLLSAVATQLVAAPLDESKIQFIGPLGTQSTIKPHNTPHQKSIINNLLPQLQKPNQKLEVFGNTRSWQSLEQVNALTVNGMQALRFNFSTTRFVEGTLALSGIEKAHVFLNGEPLTGKSEFSIHAVTGDHQVIIITEQVDDWKKVVIDYTPKAEHDEIVLTQKTTTALSAKQLYDAPTISAISLSPNGKFYVATERHYQANRKNAAISNTSLRNIEGDVLYRLSGVAASQVSWSPDSNAIVFTQDKRVSILNIKDFSIKTVAEHFTGASGYQFFDEDTLIFSWSNTPDDKHTLVKHYSGLEDRWSYARSISQPFLLDVKSGLVSTISESKLSTRIADFDNERNTVLVTRNPVDYAAPPHMLTQLVEIDLSNHTENMLGEYRTFNRAKYTDKGIYVIAGPDFSQGLGRNLPKDMLANNYDGQLYLLNNDGEKPQALSKKFDPAIGGLQVLSNGDAVLNVTDKDTKQLYLYDESKRRFKKLNTGFDVVERYSVSDSKKGQVLVTGSQASSPQALSLVTVKRNKTKVLWDSKPVAYDNSEIAALEEFNFTNESGTQISGRVYLPHNLDTSKKHPALIYYYGGTSPVSRGFTGRYPFNLWAAQGYVVYVVQPTGATGFGQEFSAKHVNAWGEHTADDIIQGTNEFLKAYPFVDKNRLGNLGASYGGFMTMLLATKTDLFSASIAHAGISNITSYWGQGWWGYLYSGEASKNSFPWNNPSLYSQHSPVFHADKVTTPLLLVHGDADTNVPPGESHNMYTALKLLGQDVELIEYKGADHQIIVRDRRFHWWDTMLAYFDMHLKDQPQWWDHIYSK